MWGRREEGDVRMWGRCGEKEKKSRDVKEKKKIGDVRRKRNRGVKEKEKKGMLKKKDFQNSNA
jgi:hypothetical protein